MILKPIGVVHSPLKNKKDAPHQGHFSKHLSKIIIYEEFVEAMEGLADCKYLYILYWFDRSKRDILKVVPRGGTKKRGVFSTRAPVRPNPIGLCLVELLKVEGNILTVKWFDALDETPVLDIKPFWSDIDSPDGD